VDRIAGAGAARELLRGDAALRKKLFAHAYSLTRNEEDANDLGQQAMARVIDPDDSPWDPDKQPNLLLYMGSLMNGIMSNRRRGERRHPTSSYESASYESEPEPAAAEPSGLERIERAEEAARMQRRVDLLRQRLTGDTLALAKIDLMVQGIDEVAEQAALLKCTVADVYAANRRIAYHVAQMRSAAPDEASRPTMRAVGSAPEAPS
jgi:DNA-directed RNA polymerase specialized sigma24 family protein